MCVEREGHGGKGEEVPKQEILYQISFAAQAQPGRDKIA